MKESAAVKTRSSNCLVWAAVLKSKGVGLE